MRLRSIILMSVMLMVIFVIPSDCAEASETDLADGSHYSYRTFGNDFSSYRCTIDLVSSDADVLYISTVLEGYNVTELIRVDAPNASMIVVPERIETIHEDAFEGCTDLEDLYFLGSMPDTPFSIPEGVVLHHLPGSAGWSAGEEITILHGRSADGSVVRYAIIDNGAMVIGGEPSSDGSIIIESEVDGHQVTSIGPYAFAGRENSSRTSMEPRTDIISVTIPEGVTVIRERSFFYNGGMTSVSMPGTLTVIMDEAFRGASSLRDADIPDGVTHLGFESFRNCSSLEEVTIPDSVGYAGEGTFKVCPSVRTLVIGSGLERVADWMFSYNSSLESVEFRGSPSGIGASAFYMCSSLRSVDLPDSVGYIGAGSFLGCSSMASVTLPSSLVTIGADAFEDCRSITDITIPAKVESIGDKAFAYCSSMEDIRFLGPRPDLGRAVFLNCDATIHCTSDHRDSWEVFDGVVVDGGDRNIAIYVLTAALLSVCAVIHILVRRR